MTIALLAGGEEGGIKVTMTMTMTMTIMLLVQSPRTSPINV